MGVELEPRNATLTVNAAALTVVCPPVESPYARRKAVTITNTSTGGQNVTVAFGEDVTAGKGYFLVPYSTLNESKSENYECFQGRITAIASAIAGSVAVVERVESV